MLRGSLMRTYTLTTFLIIFLILNQSIHSQQIETKRFNPLSSKTAFGFSGGLTYAKTDFTNSKADYILNLTGDYYFPTYNSAIFGINIEGSYGYAAGTGRPGYRVYYPPLDEFRTKLMMLSGGVSVTYANWKNIYPYAAVRAGWINYQPMDADGNELSRNRQNLYSPNDWFAVGELGVRFMLSNSVSFNAAATMDYLPFDNLDDSPNSITGGTDKDIFFTGKIGFSFYFGGITDTDNDGVSDDDDLCPDTPPNVKVDEHGCPTDTDKDGVPDYLDKCPNTPRNVPVDMNGCPLDVDGDGVPDYLDLCPDTPTGVRVDSRGCPLDEDEDGVPDYRDLCPNTPIGTEVNKWGCPNEEKEYEPIKQKEIILNGAVNFEINKAGLLPAAYTELNQVLKVMQDYPDTKWRIEGHTDNTGSYKLNKELSLKRAQAVYNYFVNNGIDGTRLFVKGLGPDFPVADNNTETGRALNRRVAIVLVTGNEPDKESVNDLITSRTYNVSAERNVGRMIFTDGYLYCFQVSSWRSREKAESEMKKLKAKGYDAFIVIANLPELDGTWYRVRVGYFGSMEEAERARNNVKI